MFTLLTGLVLAASLAFSPPAGYSALPGSTPSDSDISRWVRFALTHDPRTDASYISVETRAGVVKLIGDVDNLAARNYAVAETKKINGVRGVIDEISVTPVSRSDRDLAHDIRRRLENSTAVDARNLVVAVHQGVVTLSGEAADWNQKEEARLLAEGIRGVKDVVDDVQLEYSDTISDERLTSESRARLARDVYLSDLPITVAVQNGEITLTGSVGNLYEKERAERSLLWQNGVKSVINNLKVEPRGSYGVRDTVAVPSD
jgi:osmotically-inducible protein OsmY